MLLNSTSTKCLRNSSVLHHTIVRIVLSTSEETFNPQHVITTISSSLQAICITVKKWPRCRTPFGLDILEPTRVEILQGTPWIFTIHNSCAHNVKWHIMGTRIQFTMWPRVSNSQHRKWTLKPVDEWCTFTDTLKPKRFLRGNNISTF